MVYFPRYCCADSIFPILLLWWYIVYFPCYCCTDSIIIFLVTAVKQVYFPFYLFNDSIFPILQRWWLFISWCTAVVIVYLPCYQSLVLHPKLTVLRAMEPMRRVTCPRGSYRNSSAPGVGPFCLDCPSGTTTLTLGAVNLA